MEPDFEELPERDHVGATWTSVTLINDEAFKV